MDMDQFHAENTEMDEAWREGVAKFLAAGFQEGEVIPKAWFYEALGVQMPVDTDIHGDAEQAILLFLQRFQPMRQELLIQHKIDLATERGQGYRWTPPQEQTQVSYRQGTYDLAKALRKMRARLHNVDLNKLTPEQRLENTNAKARAAAVANAVRTNRVPRNSPVSDASQ